MEAAASLPAVQAGVLLPAQADQWEADALEAIGAVSTPDEAEALLARIKLAEQALRLADLGREREQRWGRVRLLGERRYGELLGPAENHGPATLTASKGSGGADHVARHRARQVAEVPETQFEEYVATAEQPTRAGLLRMGVHYSSQTDEWATPADFYAVVDTEFSPVLDVCALASSAKCERYFTPEDDGLAQEWTGVCWMNPPYGAAIGEWVAKAHRSAQDGATVICLVPARTDTAWWHDHCTHGEVRFLRGRLRFGDAEASAPFPSALVVFGREPSMSNWDWRA